MFIVFLLITVPLYGPIALYRSVSSALMIIPSLWLFHYLSFGVKNELRIMFKSTINMFCLFYCVYFKVFKHRMATFDYTNLEAAGADLQKRSQSPQTHTYKPTCMCTLLQYTHIPSHARKHVSTCTAMHKLG